MAHAGQNVIKIFLFKKLLPKLLFAILNQEWAHIKKNASKEI